MIPTEDLISPHEEGRSILARRLRELASGARLTVIGLDQTGLVTVLPSGMPPVLLLDLTDVINAQALISLILDDLADLALAVWPAWPPSPLAPWRRAADKLAAVGRRPRFSKQVQAETQFRALLSAAGSPVLLFAIDPIDADRAAPVITTLEWTGRHGAAAIVLFREHPPNEAPWDRVLYGALTIPPAAPAPAIARLVAPHAPPVGDPRGSFIERRMRAALAAHADLAGLFENEVMLRLGPLGPTPRVDLLWAAGKVVIELDGPEHERDAYAADRHRDYELLIAGYLVLRLTNAEVELDLARSLDKIRRVVNLRREPA